MSARRGWSRREFSAALASLAWTTVGRSLAAAADDRRPPTKPSRSPRRPSRFLVFFLAGGMDELYSINPMHPGEVKQGILPVYTERELITHGAARLAPMWSSLAPYLPRMQVISGIQCSTVAHPTGVRQVRQMRRHVVSERETSFITLAGEAIAPEAPLHALHINAGYYPVGPTAEGRVLVDDSGGKILASLHRLANDPALRDVSRAALASAARTDARTAEPTRIVDAMIAKMAGTPAPTPSAASVIDPAEWPWHTFEEMKKGNALEYAWVLYALQRRLAPAVFLSPLAFWDTHWNNDIMQRPLQHQFALGLKYVLDGLAAAPGDHGGSLLDETGIVILSELGRFPYVNSVGGKDHYPQITAVLMGPGLAPGKFGETDSELLGTSVSLTTGRPGRGGRLLTLDDLGTTLLHWLGNPDPPRLGYDGSLLEFCFA